jgi:acetyl esterase/lipase
MPNTQLEAVIDLLTSREAPDNPTVHDSRTRFEKLVQAVGGETAASVLQVDADGVPAELLSSGGTSTGRAILYLHGGGYVIGSTATHRELARRLSVAADADVLVIDYRLAPENPFPAAVEDAVSAYRWLIGQGCEPADIAIAGDSAGGGLTVATLVSLRDQGLPLPSCGVCLSPWVDMEGIGDSMTTRSVLDPMVQREGLVAMAETYLGGAAPRTPLAAPLYADLRGLPPLLIQVGTSETLYDDSTRLAERAGAAGVETSFESWEEMIHVWHLFAPMLDEGQRAIERIGEFVRAKTAVR